MKVSSEREVHQVTHSLAYVCVCVCESGYGVLVTEGVNFVPKGLQLFQVLRDSVSCKFPLADNGALLQPRVI